MYFSSLEMWTTLSLPLWRHHICRQAILHVFYFAQIKYAFDPTFMLIQLLITTQVTVSRLMKADLILAFIIL